MSICYDLQKWTVLTLASVAITMIVGIVLMQYAHGQTTNETPTNETSKVPTGKLESKAFTIRDLKAVQHDGKWEVSGTIKNITNESITGIVISVTFYGTGDRDQSIYQTVHSTMDPQQEYSFETDSYDLGLDVDHYVITMSSDR